MKSERAIQKIASEAYKTGILAAEWGWSAEQWANAVEGMKQRLLSLGADEFEVDKIVKIANNGYSAYVEGGGPWIVVRRGDTGEVCLARRADFNLSDSDIVMFRGTRPGAEDYYESLRKILGVRHE